MKHKRNTNKQNNKMKQNETNNHHCRAATTQIDGRFGHWLHRCMGLGTE
jgi:hypothetical protein